MVRKVGARLEVGVRIPVYEVSVHISSKKLYLDRIGASGGVLYILRLIGMLVFPACFFWYEVSKAERAAWRGVAARGEMEHASLARGMRAGRVWPSTRGVRPASTEQQSSFERGGSWPMAMPCPVPNREMGWARMEGWMTSGPWLMVF